MDSRLVKLIANNNRWQIVSGKHSNVIEFKRMAWRIIVDCSRNRVMTILKHPKLGWSKLVRANVDEQLLTHIFHYPRVHTDNGVHLKKIKH
jgi:hypothetical protein